ncbi:DUF4474 domain-containing protein [Clostridium chromiireducens]|uniref:DUF4474 domain-containing protein n=1 Tax=Clostridium chromiireducens TaxID=225345 RepID=A0A964W4J8_9CLOT|nr:DUF4474 domain-containing protein [Clostridium chromiireducens]MVX66367.1 DUF4474 domain-containing protein [Clostridium chromiireducens]
MFGALIAMLTGIRIIKDAKGGVFDILNGKGPIEKAMEAAGYDYDPEQDIFYCVMNPWQRNMGYNRLYDEAMAPFGMIVDCEPIYFEYKNKIWLVELWKGQYDVNTGCEIGIYTADKPVLNIPEMYKFMFFNCANDEEKLTMSFTLKKNGKILFSRDEKHWWLAGFKLGEYSEPSELVVNLNITLKDEEMCNAFVEALNKIGYEEEKISVNGYTVGLIFDEPHTPQPITRIEETDKLIQAKNKLLCEKYNEITNIYNSFTDKINALKDQAPEIYSEIIDKATLRTHLRSINNTEML